MASSSSISTFNSFYTNWLFNHEHLLRHLESLQSPQQCTEAIPIVFSHYHEFFNQKSRIGTEDVFFILSPPWMTSFERSLLWISSFRPSILFRIINKSVDVEMLSNEKKLKLEGLKAESIRREKEITMGMARVQESVAETTTFYQLMRRCGRLVEGEVGMMERAMEELKLRMVIVVGKADELREWVGREVVEVLGPVEGVTAMAAVMRFQLQARNWGRRWEERERGERGENGISAVDG